MKVDDGDWLLLILVTREKQSSDVMKATSLNYYSIIGYVRKTDIIIMY